MAIERFTASIALQLQAAQRQEEAVRAAKALDEEVKKVGCDVDLVVDSMSNELMINFGALPERLVILQGEPHKHVRFIGGSGRRVFLGGRRPAPPRTHNV